MPYRLWPWLLVIVCFWAQVKESWCQSVVVSTVRRSDVSPEPTYVGTVEPIRRSVVGSTVEGLVTAYQIESGDLVRAGQPLAQLRTRTLEIQLAAARSELELRNQELLELKNGALKEEIQQAAARQLAAQIAQEIDRKRFQRLQDLSHRNAVSQDEVDTARATAEQSQQRYLEAQAYHELVTRGPRAERLAQATARSEAQQQQVHLLEEQLREHTIRAPFDGYVISEHSEVGQWVERGGPLAEIVQLDQVDVIVYTQPAHIRALKKGTTVVVRVPEYEPPLQGSVHRVVPQADTASRAVPVVIRVANQQTAGGTLLQAGAMVRVALPTSGREDALLVEKDALVLGVDGIHVFVLEAGEGETAVRKVAVETGAAQNDWIEIRGALQAGDQVVIEGNERLQDRQRVKVKS